MYKRLLIAGTIVVVLIGFVWCGLTWYASPLQAVVLSGLQWTSPQFLALSSVQRDGYPGILFVRLSDGTEQFIAGDWKTNLSQKGNAYAFGYFPDGYSTQIGQQVYAIQPTSVTDITVSDTAGAIVSIRENGSGTYMLIEMLQDDTRFYCLAELNTEQTPVCTDITVPGGGTARWNPLADHEVVIQNAVGEILLYDPWNPGFRDVSADDSEQFNALNDLFTDTADPPAAVYNFGNLAVVKSAGTWQWLRIPWFAQVALIGDSSHLLALTSNSLVVIDSTNKQYSNITSYEGQQNTAVQFYNPMTSLDDILQ